MSSHPTSQARIVTHIDAPQGDHLDLFFELPDSHLLETYEAPIASLHALITGQALEWTQKHPHRRHYLAYSGTIGDNRGSIREQWSGTHTLNTPDFTPTIRIRRHDNTLSIAP